MVDWTPIALGSQSNPGRDEQAGDARLINCYVEQAGEDGVVQLPIYACDGFNLFKTLATSGTGAPRAMLALTDSALYVVSGTKLVKLNAGATETAITGTLPATGIVTMARNRKEPNAQIGIAVGGELWFCENDVLTQFSLASLDTTGTLVSISAVDGYFCLLFDNGEFFISAIDNSTIDSLDFAKAESSPDAGVTSRIRGRELVLFGTASTEWWQNTGAADFPFQRVSTAGFGAYAAGSVCNVLHVGDSSVIDTIAFCSTNDQGAYAGVSLLDGYGARKISTPGVDRMIEAETDKTAIRSFTYSMNGHTFYALSTSTATQSYDLATGRWHERKSSGLEFWRVRTAVSFGTKVLVGDYTSAKLYRMSPSVYSSSASVLTLKHSNSNGDTWNATRTANIGGSGARNTAIKFNRLGQSREDGKVFNVSISNAISEDGTGVAMTVQPPTITAWPKRVRFYGARVNVISGASENATPKGILGLAVKQSVLNG